MEGHYRTEPGVPLTLGGIPDDEAMTTRYALRIPRGLSLLARGDPRAVVRGLDSIPRDDWPNTRIVHWAFDLMVAAGFTLLALTPDQTATPIDEAPGGERVALMLGAEGDGLSSRWLREADSPVCIPMSKDAMDLGVDSLNVVAAAAIACHDLMRTR
jgi:tRNA(Leu) C34 or U34 (ribose-2'-O)-methylase TrmL